jgi:hypothetical protein
MYFFFRNQHKTVCLFVKSHTQKVYTIPDFRVFGRLYTYIYVASSKTMEASDSSDTTRQYMYPGLHGATFPTTAILKNLLRLFASSVRATISTISVSWF